MSADEAREGFGALLDAARREPVAITNEGRETLVVLLKEEFERLEALEDALWAARAAEADKEGYLGPEESEKLLDEWLNAKD